MCKNKYICWSYKSFKGRTDFRVSEKTHFWKTYLFILVKNIISDFNWEDYIFIAYDNIAQ